MSQETNPIQPHVLIGGPADGRRVHTSSQVTHLSVPIRDPIPLAPSCFTSKDPFLHQKPHAESYMLAPIHLGGSVKEVYLHSPIYHQDHRGSCENLFSLLIEGYRQPRTDIEQPRLCNDGSFTLTPEVAKLFISILSYFDSGECRSRELMQLFDRLFRLIDEKQGLPFLSQSLLRELEKRAGTTLEELRNKNPREDKPT